MPNILENGTYSLSIEVKPLNIFEVNFLILLSFKYLVEKIFVLKMHTLVVMMVVLVVIDA